jgi:hypothetical protein
MEAMKTAEVAWIVLTIGTSMLVAAGSKSASYGLAAGFALAAIKVAIMSATLAALPH